MTKGNCYYLFRNWYTELNLRFITEIDCWIKSGIDYWFDCWLNSELIADIEYWIYCWSWLFSLIADWNWMPITDIEYEIDFWYWRIDCRHWLLIWLLIRIDLLLMLLNSGVDCWYWIDYWMPLLELGLLLLLIQRLHHKKYIYILNGLHLMFTLP